MFSCFRPSQGQALTSYLSFTTLLGGLDVLTATPCRPYTVQAQGSLQGVQGSTTPSLALPPSWIPLLAPPAMLSTATQSTAMQSTQQTLPLRHLTDQGHPTDLQRPLKTQVQFCPIDTPSQEVTEGSYVSYINAVVQVSCVLQNPARPGDCNACGYVHDNVHVTAHHAFLEGT